ncbi:ankyrin repeat domain-containing protein [Actibacterium sp.]|uniref:ankyrin repeat domain-containing protein n=1 Tax=Actibacterium sp. TaxID=1872125 RepID=UPI003563ED9F
MTNSIEKLRRAAKALQKACDAGDAVALTRLKAHVARSVHDLKRADYLHVVAREAGFDSWPALKFAAETVGLDRAARQQRLKVALYHGQNHVVQALLDETPDLAEGLFGLQVALLNLPAVRAVLADDPEAATRKRGPRTPMLHLAFSRYIHARPELKDDMLAIASLLVANGADVNDAMPAQGGDTPLSALYGAIGHADNMVLGQWLLDHGADPNDGESLYHAVELGHHSGLKMLLAAGADPRGTNAVLRAMDFNDHVAVEMLLAHGARPDEDGAVPALHHAALRMSDARMVGLLLGAGADPAALYQGVTAYGHARVVGNADLAHAIESHGTPPDLTEDEALLAAAADGGDTTGRYINPARLPEVYRNILRDMAHLPGKLDHMKRLVALGLEYDRPDAQGVTPVQSAGWEGMPEVMGWLIALRPDLGHVNAHGGTLLGAIIHGSENCPQRADRDHVTCARMALEHGVALPRKLLSFAGDPAIAAFLADWGRRYPGQVVTE